MRIADVIKCITLQNTVLVLCSNNKFGKAIQTVKDATDSSTKEATDVVREIVLESNNSMLPKRDYLHIKLPDFMLKIEE